MRGLERGISAVSLTPQQEKMFHHDKNPSIGHQVIGWMYRFKISVVIWMNWGGGAMAFSRIPTTTVWPSKGFHRFYLVSYTISDNKAFG